MNDPQDNGAPSDLSNVREESSSTDPLSIQSLVKNAPFLVYGLVDSPFGLKLKQISCATANFTAEQAASPRLRRQQYYQQYTTFEVVLHFGAWLDPQRRNHDLELVTLNTVYSPHPVPTLEDFENASDARYPTSRALLESSRQAEQAHQFVIEQFQYIQGQAIATFEYSPLATSNGSIGPKWSFGLRGPDMWVQGCANGWTRLELFSILGQMIAINHHPEILDQYTRELDTWYQHALSAGSILKNG